MWNRIVFGLVFVVLAVACKDQDRVPVVATQPETALVMEKTPPPATTTATKPSVPAPVEDTRPKLAKCPKPLNHSANNPAEVHVYGPKRTEHAVFSKGTKKLSLVHEPGAGRAMMISSLGKFSIGNFQAKTGGCRDSVLGDMWCILMDWRNPGELPIVEDIEGKKVSVVDLTTECPNQSMYFGMQYSGE